MKIKYPWFLLVRLIVKDNEHLIFDTLQLIIIDKFFNFCQMNKVWFLAAGLSASDVLMLPMDVLELSKHEYYFQQVIAHFGQVT